MISDSSDVIAPMHTDGEEHADELRDQIRALTEGIRNLTSMLTSQSENFDEKRIEQLTLTWRLEDTGFSSLFNACKQMKNTLRLTSLEADKDYYESRRVNNILSTTKLEEERLKKTLCTVLTAKEDLQKKNSILMNKVQEHKKDKKMIARSIRNFLATINEGKNATLNSSILTPGIPDLQSFNSISSSEAEDWEEISSSPSLSTSSSSSSGLVTDDGCATIRFPNREMCKKNKNHHKSRKKMRYRNELKLSFPSKYVGIQFSSVALKGFFKDSEALLVCGFMGFDNKLNQRPAFGSRLVRVDEISLERQKWKMEDLVDYICKKSGPIQMCFCDERLTTAQIGELVAISR